MYKPWGRKASLEDRNSTGSKVSSVQEATAGDREAFQSASGTTGSATQTHRKTHKIHKRIQLSVFRWGSMLAPAFSRHFFLFLWGIRKMPKDSFYHPTASNLHCSSQHGYNQKWFLKTLWAQELLQRWLFSLHGTLPTRAHHTSTEPAHRPHSSSMQSLAPRSHYPLPFKAQTGRIGVLFWWTKQIKAKCFPTNPI